MSTTLCQPRDYGWSVWHILPWPRLSFFGDIFVTLSHVFTVLLQGVISHAQLEELTDKQLMEKHKNFRLNTEVHQDSERMWCPDPNCHTIISIQSQEVICPSCSGHFCSSCSSSWHGPQPCSKETAVPWAELEDRIKPCPVCLVPIERDEGCAQMMCRSCKHVFCWFCSTSLDVSSSYI